MIANVGFNMETKLAEIHVQGEWRWPTLWVERFPVLANLRHIVLNANSRDKLVWKTRVGRQVEFSTTSVWDDVRTTQNEVQWAKVVWFSQAIPRHSFIMWLIVNKKLKTQDIMRTWNSSGNANFNLMCCSLCTSGPDSHEHLFFECGYASDVWNGVKQKADVGTTPNQWHAIFDYLLGIANSKKITHVIVKLLMSTAAYFVWDERNRRLFATKRRNKTQLVDVILSTVRLKLQTMKFKSSLQME
ncbi:uncharacterized protein LOC110893236 [Helianthus annuus]|uniref:uncharacterized protein LOC110893236 n=1 Tax=Helianthus annuus TaxID=4232 RepID=UPI000B8F7141|nr:uncharacterized protein LOC110893236 [Helianthus annuus]